MQLIKLNLFVVSVLLCHFLRAQNYQAINGSMYGGSLSTGSNPASIMHVPYKWDVTLFALQAKQCTNAFKVNDLSLLSFAPSNTTISNNNGVRKRFLFANQDLRLLNARFRLNESSTIAFGANIRNYMHASVSKSNWQDTANYLFEFLNINSGHIPLSGQATGTAWAELFGSYARTIVDNGDYLLNAGATVKINRSLAGGYAKAGDISYVQTVDANDYINYNLTRGNLQYGYSNNFDFIDSNQSFSWNSKTFFKRTYSTISADIGLEYIQLSQDDDADEYLYDTKIGIALLDLGSNRFRYSTRSRSVTSVKENISDTILENKFLDIENIDGFNDSLATIVNSIRRINGDFVVYQPTRLVINVDRRLNDNFYLNAELTLPVIQLAGNNSLHVKDMNLLAVTPRWETKTWGAYMPVLMNVKKQVWFGGAIKAGPVLVGTHNLANIFSKKSMQNGGLYLAVTIRPGNTHDRTKGDNAGSNMSKREKRKLGCPDF